MYKLEHYFDPKLTVYRKKYKQNFRIENSKYLELKALSARTAPNIKYILYNVITFLIFI